MSHKNVRNEVWYAAVGFLVLAALGYWWISSGMAPSSIGGLISGNRATTTESVGTGTEPTTKPSNNVSDIVTTSKRDVVSIVAGLQGVSAFKSYFVSTGVSSSVYADTGGTYTVFVPTDGAISQLAKGTISNLSAADKKRLVQYHVIKGRAVDADALISGSLTALSGDMLNFSVGPAGLPMVNSSLVVTQHIGTNGIVYVIDNVLFPPKRGF